MKRVILQEFVSIDGLAAAQNGSVDFVPSANRGDQSLRQRQVEFMDSIDTILLGRVTYEMFAGYWPNANTGDDKELAEKINSTPKVVFSRTLHRAPWGQWDNVRIVNTKPAEELAKLRDGSGKDMVIWGSLSLAQALMNAGQIDQYQLIVCPVVLGNGRPLFPEKNGVHDMKLLNARSFDRGSVLLSYASGNGASENR
jgi:dihydrofolate reductase